MKITFLDGFPESPKDKKYWPWTFNTEKIHNSVNKDILYPTISIITPSFNQGQFIEETIRSVLFQEYPNLEYIIIDGCSSDNSLEIIKKYENWLTYWISEKDGGQSSALNKGFKMAKGNILGWLNSDDYYPPGSLLKVGKFFAENQECNFLSGDGEFFGNPSKKINFKINADSYNFYELLKYHNGKYLPQPSVFFSKNCFSEVGGLDESLKYTMDLDLWLKLSKKHKLNYLPQTLSMLRQHDDAKTIKNNEIAMAEVEKVIFKHSKDLNIFNKFQLFLGMKYFVARASCIAGIKYYFENDNLNAKNAMKRAFFKFPPIVVYKIGLKLWLRLLLPKSIKKFIFEHL